MATFFSFKGKKTSLLLSHQGRNCDDISSSEIEMCIFLTSPVADPLTFVQNRSALCFLTFVLLFFFPFIRSVTSLFFYSECTLCGHVAGEKIHGPISEHACFHSPICHAP